MRGAPQPPLTAPERAQAEKWLPLLALIVKEVDARTPKHVEADDLRMWGFLGLVNAIRKFDRSRGVPFKHYASQRIQHAMQDGMRSLDWAPRSARRKQKQGGEPVKEFVSLSLKMGETDSGDDVSLAARIGAKSDPCEAVDRSDLFDWITRGMSRADRLLVKLVYVEGMRQSEVWRTLGVSESCISQRCKHVERVLRAKLAPADLMN